jgi:hypothetical protein
MTRPARFTSADISRAVRAAEKCGLSVAGYEIEPNGTIRILTSLPQAANDRQNPLDRLHHG